MSFVNAEQYAIGQRFLFATMWNETKFEDDDLTDSEKLMIADVPTFQKFLLLLWQDGFKPELLGFLINQLKSAVLPVADAIAVKAAIHLFANEPHHHDQLLQKALAEHSDNALCAAVLALSILRNKNKFDAKEYALLEKLREAGWAIAACLIARALNASDAYQNTQAAHRIAAQMGVRESIIHLANSSLSYAEKALWYRLASLRVQDPRDLKQAILGLAPDCLNAEAEIPFLAYHMMMVEMDQHKLAEFYLETPALLVEFMNFEYQFFSVTDQAAWFWRQAKAIQISSPSARKVAMLETVPDSVSIMKVRLITAVAQFAMMSVKRKFPELALTNLAPLLNTIYPHLVLDEKETPESNALYATYLLILIRNCISNADLLTRADPLQDKPFFYQCAARLHTAMRPYRDVLSPADRDIYDEKAGELAKQLIVIPDAKAEPELCANDSDDDIPLLIMLPARQAKQSINHACLWMPKPQSGLQVLTELVATILSAAAGFIVWGLPGLALGLLGLLASYACLNIGPEKPPAEFAEDSSPSVASLDVA